MLVGGVVVVVVVIVVGVVVVAVVDVAVFVFGGGGGGGGGCLDQKQKHQLPIMYGNMGCITGILKEGGTCPAGSGGSFGLTQGRWRFDVSRGLCKLFLLKAVQLHTSSLPTFTLKPLQCM